jgi:hypothetical protein
LLTQLCQFREAALTGDGEDEEEALPSLHVQFPR